MANAFAYMNLVEAWGSGIPKLMQSMKEYGLREPEFVDMDVAFRVNLYRGQSTSIDLITLWFEVNRRTLTSIQINTERNIHIHKFRLSQAVFFH